MQVDSSSVSIMSSVPFYAINTSCMMAHRSPLRKKAPVNPGEKLSVNISGLDLASC